MEALATMSIDGPLLQARPIVIPEGYGFVYATDWRGRIHKRLNEVNTGRTISQRAC